MYYFNLSVFHATHSIPKGRKLLIPTRKHVGFNRTEVLFFFLVLSIFSSPWVLLAQQQPIVFDDQNQLINSSSYVEFLQSPKDQFTINDILQDSLSTEFSLLSEVPYFIGLSRTVWFRFNYMSKMNVAPFMLLSNPTAAEIDIYLAGEGPLLWKQTGLSTSYDSLEYLSTNYFIALPFEKDSLITIYCRVKFMDRAWLPLKFGSRDKLIAYNLKTDVIGIIALTILAFLLFYNLVIFFVSWDKLFGIYSLYLVGALAFVGMMTGFLHRISSVDFDWLAMTSFILYVSLMLLAQEILKIKERFPKWYKALYVYYPLCAIAVIPNLQEYEWMISIYLPVRIFITFYPPILALFSLSYKDIIVKLFFISWTPLIVWSILDLAPAWNIYIELFHDNGIKFAILWEALASSLILSYRYTLIRKEKIAAQEENLALVKEQNEILEVKVLERTEEIQTQNDQLVLQQEELQAQQEKVHEQNKLLEQSKQVIFEHNQRLEQAVKERTEDLVKMNQTLNVKYHELGQFSFIVAHIIKAPIARLLGLTQLFKVTDAEDKNNQAKVVDKILDTSEELDQVARDLDLILEARIDKASPQKVNVNNLLERIIKNLDVEGKLENTQIKKDLKKETVLCSGTYLENIVSTILLNSIDYKSPERSLVIDISGFQEDKIYVVLVKDNGMGFDSDKVKSKLFEPFQRFHETGKGRGLGLFIAKLQIENMGGSLDITSRVDQGTTVKLTLPLS